MKRVVIESPLAGDLRRNIRYAQLCLLDSLRRGEAPFASHLLYTQVLDDRMAGEREAGMQAGLEWAELADVCAVYEDFGISDGMRLGAARADSVGVVVECRKLSPDLMARVGEDPSRWETLRYKGTPRVCPGCRSLDGEHDFGPGCTLEDRLK